LWKIVFGGQCNTFNLKKFNYKEVLDWSNEKDFELKRFIVLHSLILFMIL